MFTAMLISAIILSLVARVAQAQEPIATPTSIEPAAATVAPTDTKAGVKLFDAETVQLTDKVIAILNTSDNTNIADYAHLFAFDTNASSVPEVAKYRRSGFCKSAPGDLLWPSRIAWGIFDLLLGGALSPIVPIASPCYEDSVYDDYDVTECASVTSKWNTESLHFSDPGSVMFPIYQGKTCMPGTNASALKSCTQGGYAAYSVEVSNVAQIQLAVNFARVSNLRLVIKNTGHDYNGRSTGKDALSLWTHNLKDIAFVKNYISPDYKGAAFKVGAGVQANELYKAADKNGVTTVAGICPTVGVAGGYITGGGHSPVMQLFGMGADQVVALEVVTASGRFVTATPSVNSDLYWAMLGGGGGTFGIITSAVLKAHPKIPVTTSIFSFAASRDSSVPEATFWKGFAALWDSFPAWNAAKTYSYFFLSNITGVMTFSMAPFFAPNMTVVEYNKLVAPFLANLTALNIPYTINTTYHPSFLSAFNATFAPLDQHVGAAESLPGNRILPAENWNNATIREKTLAAIKTAVGKGVGLNIYHQAPATQPKILNSVNPAFRNEASMIIAIGMPTTSDDQLGAAGRALTNDMLGPLRDVSPNGGTYGNEAEINEPNFQKAFWGANYPRLLSIKKKWDPTGLFYVHHGVGSEEWVVQDGVKFGGIPTQNGRLCRA
ncbi:FAD binding domain-containing protein [Lindgomyces ingoldianus]|uniref:FAD binding domain-containing protein n=1 Tax=Lindgomyces ingoldianus TaxID=673940 RepID=A0ACB6QSK7_9PLEO|nr:FAD binding domain-containing protein [Lindgomyces ingoldianus]KAF2469921.1 FAD binding domain-containing protein [Lindgomyces ingoldianus]